MPASGAIKLVDANVWLALAFGGHVHHSRAKAWFDRQADRTCAFCRITQLALLRHLTNSAIMGRAVQSQMSAWNIYDQLAQDPRTLLIAEPPGVEAVLRSFTQMNSPSHAIWTDAYLAGVAKAGGMEMVTFEQGFTRFAGCSLVVI